MTPRLGRSTLRPTGTALVVVLLAVLVACGDDDQPRAATEGADTAAAERSADTTTSEPPSRPDADAPGTIGAEAVLVELADLPPGWEQLPAEAHDNDGAGSCIDGLVTEGGPFDESDDRTSARAFSQSSLGAFLIAAAARPVDDGAAVVSQVEATLLGCDGETDASGFTTTIEAAPTPDGVDGAVAFRGTASDEQGAQVSFRIAAAPAGDAVVLTAQAVALGDLDPQLVDDVLATMAGKAE